MTDIQKICDLIADAIICRKYRVVQSRCLGDKSRGINTDKMVKVDIYFPIENPVSVTDLSSALVLFPVKEGACLYAIGVSHADSELQIGVDFPLPYKSAEKFPKESRHEFLINMSLHLISKNIQPYFHGARLNALKRASKDPRHINEIEWEQRRARVVNFIRSIFKNNYVFYISTH